MGCKLKNLNVGKIKMQNSDKSRNVRNAANNKVVDWWYHYVARGLGKDKSKYLNKDFMLAPCKTTPDFINFNYKPKICHYQIGQNVNVGAIVIMITTVGGKKKKKYITGYYKVKKLGNWITIKRDDWKESKRTRNIVYMDKNNSLLLLDDPIKIDNNFAQRLFPEKNKKYWDKRDNYFIQKLSSAIRNRHLTPIQKEVILTKLKKRHANGSKNYLGQNYQRLLKQVKGE